MTLANLNKCLGVHLFYADCLFTAWIASRIWDDWKDAGVSRCDCALVGYP